MGSHDWAWHAGRAQNHNINTERCQSYNDGSEQVAIVVYASTLSMVINLVVVYLFVVCMGQKKLGYVSV